MKRFGRLSEKQFWKVLFSPEIKEPSEETAIIANIFIVISSMFKLNCFVAICNRISLKKTFHYICLSHRFNNY